MRLGSSEQLGAIGDSTIGDDCMNALSPIAIRHSHHACLFDAFHFTPHPLDFVRNDGLAPRLDHFFLAADHRDGAVSPAKVSRVMSR
jgi:hypothetical protein